MLLAIDIGNSSVKFGIFDGEHLLSKFSIPTKRDSTADELKQAIQTNLDLPITAAIICSVVPELNGPLTEFLSGAFGIEPVLVQNDFDFGMKIAYEPLSSIGTDRLVNAFAAATKYGAPCIVCSFGTATTIDAVGAGPEFLGGVIAPGMEIMAEALHHRTSQLPRIEIAKPENVIGTSTLAAIQSGIFYGHIALAEGIIARIKTELAPSDTKPKVIATGGFAAVIASESKAIDVVDENLLLDGLRLLFEQTN